MSNASGVNDRLSVTPPSSSPFPLRGVIEGFYGTFYTFLERCDMIRFLGANGFNFYMYGPKNDRQHRARWWDPYPPPVLDEFGECIRIGKQEGVAFCYAISFGVPMNYASPRDFKTITDKFQEFYDRGCRSFGVLVDDITDGFVHDVNKQNFQTMAQAHGDVCTRLLVWLRSLDERCALYLCPTEYYGRAPFSDYLSDLGRHLHPDIDVFYSGPDIASREITTSDVAAIAETVGRKPVMWDNYPVNDLVMRPEMHLGPLRGRDPLLYKECKGFAANSMNQAEASKIALSTIGEYLADPEGYDPESAWTRALMQVGGGSYESLRVFAENSLGSPLQEEEAPTMSRLGHEALAAIKRGESVASSPAVRDLADYFDHLDEACYHLKNRMRNLALRQNLLPWIEALEDKLWMGRFALGALKAMEEGTDYQQPLRRMNELLDEVRRSPRHVGGTSLRSLAKYTHDRALPLRGVSGTRPEGSVSAPTARLSPGPGAHHAAATGGES
jgi:hyaluronoglucosaminidase